MWELTHLLPNFESSRPSIPTSSGEIPGFTPWLHATIPEFSWDWSHLVYARKHLVRITRHEIDRLAFAWPPQHGKTRGITVPYPAWRMLREPGLRCGIGAHTQGYADKISRWILRLVVRAGGQLGSIKRANEWELTNGSTFIAKGVGSSIAGESLDLFMMDDVFGSRETADSAAMQEKVHEWYMDDVTPRLQKRASLVFVNTRWGPGDLIGRIQQSEEWPEWSYHNLPAIAEENDLLGREPGTALCEDRFPLEKLLQKRRIEGVGFESLYQGNPIPRGGTFFERSWFGSPLPTLPENCRLVRYWDFADSRSDSACYTAGVLMAKEGEGEASRFYVVDVIRGRWMPAERNEVVLQTAQADALRAGFERTYFEKPVYDKGGAASKAIVAKLAGYRVSPDNVSGSGSKELRAEPLAGAAKAGIIRLIAGSWNGAYLTEMESFPRGQYKDQADSSSGCYNKLSKNNKLAFAFA